MAGSRRRTQVGEVCNCLQSRVEFPFAEATLQRGLLRDERVPVGFGRWVAKHLRCDGAKRIYQSRVELPAAPVTGHLDGGVCPVGAVEHLDGVGKVE